MLYGRSNTEEKKVPVQGRRGGGRKQRNKERERDEAKDKEAREKRERRKIVLHAVMVIVTWAPVSAN